MLHILPVSDVSIYFLQYLSIVSMLESGKKMVLIFKQFENESNLLAQEPGPRI